MINEFVHGTICFTVRNKHTTKTEVLRRKHNWYAKCKTWDEARQKEQRRFKKNWNADKGDFICLSVTLLC